MIKFGIFSNTLGIEYIPFRHGTGDGNNSTIDLRANHSNSAMHIFNQTYTLSSNAPAAPLTFSPVGEPFNMVDQDEIHVIEYASLSAAKYPPANSYLRLIALTTDLQMLNNSPPAPEATPRQSPGSASINTRTLPNKPNQREPCYPLQPLHLLSPDPYTSQPAKTFY